MAPLIHVSMPEGMEDVMESLTRAILKAQPNNIYEFAAEHFETLIKSRQAQSSGLSPSPTDDTGQKVIAPAAEGTDQETKSNVQVVSEEKPPEEPESNDTSYGVEATAVRTLAASTGTVAILGTTAKVKEANDVSSEELPERTKEEGQCPSISITEPDPDSTNEAEEAAEAEQIGLEEKVDHAIAEEPKEKELPKNDQQIKEDETEVKAKEIEQINDKPQNDSEPTQEVLEKIIPQSQEVTASKEMVVEVSLPQKVEEKTPDQIENKVKENKEISLVSSKSEPETQKEENVLAKEEPKLPVKEPVRIVDYQEKKDAFLPKRTEEKVPEHSEKVDKHDSNLKTSDNVEQGVQNTPETFEASQDKKDVDSEEGAKAIESDGALEETEETHDDSKTEDNEISSEQLKTNSLSDMSLSEALNSEGEEAAREAAKAQELQEMVASLSATADRRALEYEIASSDAGNSKDLLLNESIVGTSAYGSEAMQTISESPVQDEIENEPEVQINIKNETFSHPENELESLKISDTKVQPDSVPIEKEVLKEPEEVNQSIQESKEIQGILKESEKLPESVNKFSEEPDKRNILEEEPEHLKELDKLLESTSLEQELDQIQKEGEKQILIEEKENLKDAKHKEEKVIEVDQTQEELKSDKKEKPIELEKPIESEKEIEKNVSTHKDDTEKEQTQEQKEEPITINKPEESQVKLNEPENILEKEIVEVKETGDEDNKQTAEKAKDENIPTEITKEMAAVADITLVSAIKTEEKPDKKADSDEKHELTLDAEKKRPQEDSISLENIGNAETQVQDLPSDTSDPPSNESNDESKLTEESRLSDKEEITEIGVLQDHSRKEKDVKSLSPEVTESSNLDSIKDNTLDNERYENQIDDTKQLFADKDEHSLNAAATTIQSSFRSFIARKQIKEDEKAGEEREETLEKDFSPSEEKHKDILGKDTALETINQKEIKILESSKEEEQSEGNEDINSLENLIQANDSKVVPEPLMKIAQAEVDRICQEAEKATESLMTPPPMIEDSDIRETDLDDSEDFPAPPDDLMDSNDKNDITKDHDSSGTQSTEPTVPLGSNTDGDSSKTEDTTAPSLAESEIKSNEPTPSQQNDDYKLESSFTENINTEVAVNRDSTEGELTMEEDSKEEELGSILQSSKEQEFESNDKEQKPTGTLESENKDKAAAIIQAGYRGFRTRKDLKKVTDDGDAPKEDQKEETTTLEETHSEKHNVTSPSTENSVSEPKDDNSSTSKSEEELNESAKKIQAGIRGYLVRKDQKVKRDAAVKIQSHFRGFKTRQRLKQESP